MNKAVVIVSGGMDSITLLHSAFAAEDGVDLYALSFNYGQKHKRELECAKWHCDLLGVPHKVVDITAINDLLKGSTLTDNQPAPEGHYAAESMKATVVPNRNAILLNLAIGYAISIGADTVAYGAHGGDHCIYPDCRPLFVDAMRVVARVCDWKEVAIEAPFLYMDKSQILAVGRDLEVDYARTWTCYNGRERACGKCGACVERILAFNNNLVNDPLEYEAPWEEVVQNALAQRNAKA